MLRGLADLKNEKKRIRMGWSRTPTVSIFLQKGLPLSFEGRSLFLNCELNFKWNLTY